MKIVIFGDSIRLGEGGYGPYVAERLVKEGHEVFQPDDNCRFAKYTLRLLFDYREQIKDADIVHFNIGHWDLCTLPPETEPFSTIEEYKNNLRRVAKIFLGITPHVIFATTTPVRKEHPYQNNEIIQKYNKAAIEVMQELGIKINDMFPLLLPDLDNNIRSDNWDYIHPTEAGRKILIERVYQVIEDEIKTIQ